MQVDNDPFPINAIDLQGAKVLVQPEQAESTKGKNVIIGEKRPKSYKDKIQSREVVLEKAANGKNVLRSQRRPLDLGASRQLKARSELCSAEHTVSTGQIGRTNRLDRSSYGEPTKDAQAKEP
jgi:hypothetical protein